MSENRDQSRSINISGSIYGNAVTGNVAGNIISGNTSTEFEQQQTLAEAAAEIQRLLKQLEQTNPTVSESEQVAYINIATNPVFKKRVIAALQAGGEAAIEEFLDNPYVSVVKTVVKDWVKPG